jgi:hypothetical protein
MGAKACINIISQQSIQVYGKATGIIGQSKVIQKLHLHFLMVR